jgi:hypothetical protein
MHLVGWNFTILEQGPDRGKIFFWRRNQRYSSTSLAAQWRISDPFLKRSWKVQLLRAVRANGYPLTNLLKC